MLSNILKKSAALCAVLMLTGCYVPMPFEKYEITAPIEPELHTMPAIECVADEMHRNEWYSEMCSQLMELRTSCTVSERMKTKEIGNALLQMKNDYPEFFWYGRSYYATTVTDGSEINLGTPDWFDIDDLPEMYEEFVSKADELIESIPDGSDYDKVLYVHDYIIEHTVYDMEAAESNDTIISGNAYACLVDGLAVCEGYARAFQYIMNRIGIESGVCSGSNHAWNYVNIDGEYYWLDTTWDDNEETPPQHTYFLFNDDMLLRTRTLNSTQPDYHECTSTDSNYFVVNGGYFEEYNEDSVIEYIESKVDSGRCEIMFADFESYKSALYALFSDAKIRKADGVGSSELKYYRDDNMFSVDIIF